MQAANEEAAAGEATLAVPSVIAPGNHDGVHLGHRALIASARAYAQRHGLRTCALTFDPHPAACLDPENAPTMLTTHARRAELLRTAGADSVLVQPFTRDFAALSAEQFIASLLAQGARALVVGPDFRFGCKRAGDVALLQARGQERGFDVHIEEPVRVAGVRVSSSAVREALRAGDIVGANRMLGRAHELSGRVVAGDKRGRTIGFPTANLDVEPVLAPCDGVYAVVARVLGPGPRELLSGVANLGTRPTFSAGRSVEVHLFDFDRDLYDTTLRVAFVGRVRGEARFSGVAELRAQIEKDCERARELLAAGEQEWLKWI
jgi:riboflavin kinase/FMN adenylyltransferase